MDFNQAPALTAEEAVAVKEAEIARRRAPIEMAVSELADAQAGLYDAIENLRERLAPVTSPRAQDTEPPDADVSGQGTPLGNAICDQTRLIRRRTRELREMAEDLGI